MTRTFGGRILFPALTSWSVDSQPHSILLNRAVILRVSGGAITPIKSASSVMQKRSQSPSPTLSAVLKVSQRDSWDGGSRLLFRFVATSIFPGPFRDGCEHCGQESKSWHLCLCDLCGRTVLCREGCKHLNDPLCDLSKTFDFRMIWCALVS